MINLEYKPNLSTNAKYIIASCGGIKLAQRHFELYNNFFAYNFVGSEINAELEFFFQTKKNPPADFILFHDLINFKTRFCSKWIQELVLQKIENYNLDLNLDFNSFLTGLRQISPEKWKNELNIGNVKFFKFSEFIKELLKYYEYVASKIREIEVGEEQSKQLSILINDFISNLDDDFTKMLFLNALKIAQSNALFSNLIKDELFLNYFTSDLNDVERINFLTKVNLLVNILELSDVVSEDVLDNGFNLDSAEVNKDNLMREIELLQNKLEMLYSMGYDLLKDENEYKSSRFGSEVNQILKLFKKITKYGN